MTDTIPVAAYVVDGMYRLSCPLCGERHCHNDTGVRTSQCLRGEYELRYIEGNLPADAIAIEVKARAAARSLCDLSEMVIQPTDYEVQLSAAEKDLAQAISDARALNERALAAVVKEM